jgi:hypothetical protein
MRGRFGASGAGRKVCARGSGQLPARGPSTSPLGDTETTVQFTLFRASLLAAPYLLLALAGVLLWSRHHSVATVMVSLGFLAFLVARVTSLFESVEYRALVRANPNSFVIPHYHTLGFLGLWVASIGLVWYAMGGR